MFIMQEMKTELRATSKQRKFFHILTGHAARRGITRGALSMLINAHSATKIATARAEYKNQRQASKFTKWILKSLGCTLTSVTRAEAQAILRNKSKADITMATRAWRESGEGK